MQILLTTDVIHAGGAETFVLRLAQALHQRGHAVTIYPFYKNRVDYKIAQAFAPDVPVVPAPLYFIRLLQGIDGLLRRFKVDLSLINLLLINDFKKYIREHKVEIIHSHLFTADWVATHAAGKLPVTCITTVHGDYKNYSKNQDAGAEIRIRNYQRKVEDVLKRLNAVVYISEEQRLFFEEKFSGINLRLYKVYNGYQPSGVHRMLSKQDVGIEPGAFVFGMVARGIPEKGWAEVIESFNRLQLPNSCLLLVGDSDYVRSLKEKHASNRQIIFAGYSSNPVEYIKLFDVGLFASTYASESLPTVLIEYLNCGVPVVSVAIAECKNMLQSDTGAAGLLVELEHGKVPVELFKNAMLAIALDTDLYNQLQQNTAAAFKKFNMQACVEAYEKVYSNALCSRLNHRQSPRPAE